jgi:diguanylate cyclase (GGDEF)-like protein
MIDASALPQHPARDTSLTQRRVSGSPRERELMSRAFEALPAPAVIVGTHGRIIAVNAAWRALGAQHGGNPQRGGVGADYLGNCASSVGNDAAMVRRIGRRLRAVLDGTLESFEQIYPCHGAGGERWFKLVATRMPDIGALVLHVDISGLRKAEQDALALARQDPLTGIANRLVFDDRLGAALERAARLDRPLALLLIDLDRFKQINDRHGHAAGDLLLRLVARRLARRLRKVDTVARFGGDEFAVIAENLGHHGDAAFLAAELAILLRRPTRLGKLRLSPRASIGVAVLRGGRSDADRLFAVADAALYEAKAAGGGCWRLQMVEHSTATPTMAEPLRSA